MIRPQAILAVVAILLLPTWSWGADEPGSQPAKQGSEESPPGNPSARSDGDPGSWWGGERYNQWDLRGGGWGFWNSGSPAKVGEYQDLRSSPFFDVDGFSSNGTRTLMFTGTGTDQQTDQAKLYYYQPGFSTTLNYDRFLHQLDHDPLDNMLNPDQSIPLSRNPPNPKIVKDDVSVGQDYAVRVQEFRSSSKWLAADGLKGRVDVWVMQKEGVRQANAVAMCFTQDVVLPPDHPPVTPFPGQKCHVLSQPQQIDWLTKEIKPVVEARLSDWLTIEYSRPMRSFTSNDETVSRFYDHDSFPLEGGQFPATGAPYVSAPYGVVPDSFTQMDQLKISAQLTQDTKLYAFLMAGSTVDQEINMTRWFNDVDVRVTNTSIANTTLTAYGKVFNEAEQMPDAAIVQALNHPAPASFPFPTVADIANVLSQPIDYHQTTAGLKGVWRPNGGGFEKGGLVIIGGYEYADLNRTGAVFTSDDGNVTLNQSDTITNSFQVGPDYRWSPRFDTYLRYKFQTADQPLIGFTGQNGIFNTLLPQQDHIVELGFNWHPSDHFICSASLGIERGDNHSSPATVGDPSTPQNINFDEENYPMSFNVWYGATDRLSFSAGYAVYSNFVAQDIVIGDDPVPYSGGVRIPPVVGHWSYGGRAEVISLGSRYVASDRVTFTGQLEWVRGHDVIGDSTTSFPSSGFTLTDLGSYSQVINETTRLSVGADWVLRPRVVAFMRYEWYNFRDVEPGFQTGMAQGVLGGLVAMY